MPAWLRMSSPAATSAPPIQLASTGLPSMLGVGLQLLGGAGRVGHGLRGQDHEQAVAVRVLGGDLQGLGVALGVGVAQDVDRVAVAPGGGQELR